MQKLKDRGTSAVPPKKSASAYIIFCQKVSCLPPTQALHILQKRAEILKRNPMAKVTEVVKEMAKCWGEMNKEARLVYKEAAKRGKRLLLNLV